MKKILVLFLVMLFAVSAFAEDKVVAKVNGKSIYDSEIRFILGQFLAKNGMTIKQIGYDNPQLINYKKEILNKLIERELLYSLASQDIPKDIDQRVEKTINEMKKDYKSDLAFKRDIEKAGSTYSQFEAKIRKNLIMDAYIKKLSLEVNVTDDEIKKFYEDKKQSFNKPELVKASHILVKDGDELAKKEKIEKIYKLVLKNPDNFEELAKKYSEGPSGRDGGNLGYFPLRGVMDEKFSDIAFSLKVNEISKPFKTRFGYHIVKVYDHKPAENLSLDKVKHKIRNILMDAKVKKLLDKKLKEIEKKSRIEVFL